MALEQKLSLRLSQRLVMTPSLQQAIKLLQMTRMELEGELSRELEENPVLETTDEIEEAPDGTTNADNPAETQVDGEAPKEAAPEAEKTAGDDAPPEPEVENANAMDEIDLDSYFNDYLENGSDYIPRQTYEPREAVPIENTLSSEEDLYDQLLWQLHMMELPEITRRLGELIIGNLNEDGFLVATDTELRLLGASEEESREYQQALVIFEAARQARNAEPDTHPESTIPETITTVVAEASVPPEPPQVPGYSQPEVEQALAVVRSLDPPGIATRTLRECLLEQLERQGEENSLTYRMIDEEWPRVLKRQFPAIAKSMGLPLQDLREPAEAIRHLETRPGREYAVERAQYVEPDVVVIKLGDEYVIQLNDDGLPRLRVSKAYRRMLREMKRDSSAIEARQFIQEKMRSAMWLIKSLDQRQRTIYKVANSIVHQQRGFLEGGVDRLRPMVLRDVADDIGMHESTVSRVVSNKYIHTPRGLYPMKFFFHSGIDRDYGEDISSLSVKRKIQHLIQGEDPKRPLSDSELMRRLNIEGIKIARRTVAKYRDELKIPSSTDRKAVF